MTSLAEQGDLGFLQEVQKEFVHGEDVLCGQDQRRENSQCVSLVLGGRVCSLSMGLDLRAPH
jgi:hypothetical protein